MQDKVSSSVSLSGHNTCSFICIMNPWYYQALTLHNSDMLSLHIQSCSSVSYQKTL